MTTSTFTFPTVTARERYDRARGIVANTKTAMLQINRLADDALRTARIYTDPNLSPEGLGKRRAELAAEARRDLAAALETVRSNLTTALNTLATDAEKARPAINWADAAAVQRAQVKWDQVRMRLEAGMPIRHVLAGADLDTTLAIREWAPAWLDATQYRAPTAAEAIAGYTPANHDAFLRTIDQRIAEVAGGHVAATMNAAQDAQAVAAWAGEHLTHLAAEAQGVRTGQTAMGTAIAAEYAEQAVRAGWPDPTEAETETTSAEAPAAASDGGAP